MRVKRNVPPEKKASCFSRIRWSRECKQHLTFRREASHEKELLPRNFVEERKRNSHARNTHGTHSIPAGIHDESNTRNIHPSHGHTTRPSSKRDHLYTPLPQTKKRCCTQATRSTSRPRELVKTRAYPKKHLDIAPKSILLFRNTQGSSHTPPKSILRYILRIVLIRQDAFWSS